MDSWSRDVDACLARRAGERVQRIVIRACRAGEVMSARRPLSKVLCRIPFHFRAGRAVWGRVTMMGVSRRDDVLVKHGAAIRAAAERNRARAIALVGSVARGDDSADSDYDFLVDFEEGVTLFDIGGLEADLEDLLGANVDVVPRSCLRESCRAMLDDAIAL